MNLTTFGDVNLTEDFGKFVSVEKEFKDFNPYINQFNSEIKDQDKYNRFNEKFEAKVRKAFASGQDNVSIEQIFKGIDRKSDNENNAKTLEMLASESRIEVEEEFENSSTKNTPFKRKKISLENKSPITLKDNSSKNNSPKETSTLSSNLISLDDDSSGDDSSGDGSSGDGSSEVQITEDVPFLEIETKKENSPSKKQKNEKEVKNDKFNWKEIDEKKRMTESDKTHKPSKRAIFEFNKYSIISIAGLIFTGVGLYVASKPLTILGIVVVFGTLGWKCFDIYKNSLASKESNYTKI